MIPRVLKRLPRYPLETFIWTRLLIWGATALTYLVFEAQYAQPLHTGGAEDVVKHDVGWAIDVWARWDSGWYLHIAQHGYTDPSRTTAFFPLYPLLVRGVGWLFLGHYVLAGFLISAAASVAAFVLLWRLARELTAGEVANRSVLYLALFPTTLFLVAVYSESLYLALSVTAFLLARRSRWGWAGLTVGLATLARVSGVVLLPALAVLAWRAPRRGSALLRLALSLPVMALWPLFLGLKYDRPFAFLTAQRSGWQRHLSAAGPLGGAWDALVAGWHGVLQLVSGGNYFPNPDHSPMYWAGLNLEQLAYAALLVALGIYAWRALGAAYGVFVLGSLALPFSDPVPSTPLLSIPRFALGVFPVFIALGLLGRSQRVHTGLLVGLTLLLGINLARWTLWIWVA
jgi:hypothetical protein